MTELLSFPNLLSQKILKQEKKTHAATQKWEDEIKENIEHN